MPDTLRLDHEQCRPVFGFGQRRGGLRFDQRVHARWQRFGAVGVDARAHRGGDRLDAQTYADRRQRILAGKVLVEAANADAGQSDHLADRNPIMGLFGKELEECVADGIGENVYSKEVEDVLAAHPDIQDVAVIGRPHAQWGETVVAVVVARPGTQPDPEAIKAFAAERLARYKVPREFELRDALPRTPTGKLMKHILRKDFA